jgi:hypothetical protein
MGEWASDDVTSWPSDMFVRIFRRFADLLTGRGILDSKSLGLLEKLTISNPRERRLFSGILVGIVFCISLITLRGFTSLVVDIMNLKQLRNRYMEKSVCR